MRVLIAGHWADDIGGIQTYERDLASWLIAGGHSPVIFSAALGNAARELDRRTIPVTDDLRTITAPIDVIHGDSALETMAALLHLSDTPAIFVCHAWGGLTRTTPHFPRILRYVAVDDTCADRLLLREGIAPEKVSVILNAVDLDAFRQRDLLPARPRRAVVFGNTAHELTFLPAIREACRRASIDVDVVSAMTGTAVSNPQSILGRYDLAFAKAKCAIEAMACGLAVVLCDATGVGGMVRAADLDRLRRLNFGIRSLQKPLSADAILAELALYDPDDARAVSNRIRQTASSNELHESLFSLYQAVVEEQAHAGAGDRLAENQAAAAFLQNRALQEHQRSADFGTLAKAAQRMLQIPIVGPIARRAIRGLTRRK
jgi:glycosyltransferase involved in cell wall biosynthesis